MGEGGLFQIAGILSASRWAAFWRSCSSPICGATFEQPGSSGLFLAGIFAVLLYVGVLVHELAHAWAARSFGYPVQGITQAARGLHRVQSGVTQARSRVRDLGRGTAVDAGHRCRMLGPGRGDQWIHYLSCSVPWLSRTFCSARSIFCRGAAGRWRNREVSRLAGHRIGELRRTRCGIRRSDRRRSGGCAGGGAAEPRAGGLLTAVLAVFLGFGAYQSLQSAKQGRAPRLDHPALAADDPPGAGRQRGRPVGCGALAVGSGVPGRGGDRGWPGRLLAACRWLPPTPCLPTSAGRSQWVLSRSPFRPSRGLSWDDQPSRMLQALADSGQSVVFVTEPDGRPLGFLMAAT